MNHIFANWKSPSEYPNPDVTDRLEWLWQFLRRNPQYQKDYEEYVRPFLGRHANDDNLDGYVCNPPALEGENRAAYRKRCAISGVLDMSMIKKPHYMAEKWGLSGLPLAPEYTHARGNGLAGLSIKKNYSEYYIGNIPEARESSEYEAWCKFDLTSSLDEQWERLKDFLEHHQSQCLEVGMKQKRIRDDLYRDYLRILDAEQAGADASEISSVIYPDIPNEYPDYLASKRVRNAFIAAKKLRDSEWINIVR